MNLPLSKSAKVRGDAGIGDNRPAQLRGYPMIEDPNGPNRHIQSRYEECRRNGCTHSLAEMLAYQQAPASRTDDDFFRGVGTLDKQLGDCTDDGYLERVTKRYTQEMGHPPNPNHVLIQGLSQYEGDPRAWVASSGEAKRRAEELNVGMEGFVTNKARQPESDPFAQMAAPQMKRAPIASDLKNLIADQMVKRDPSLKGRVNPGMLDAVHGNHVKER